MFWELIAVIVAGVAGAGVVMLLARATGGRVPKWLIPVGAGAAMLATSISNEYSWYDATSGNLPEGVLVAETHESRALWRPWTYLVPMVDRFVAADLPSMQPNADTEGLWLVQLHFFQRWHPTRTVQVMVDCPGARRAAPSGGDGGEPRWIDVTAEDPILVAVCGGGA
ncbi:hypothetical protein [Salipiger sp.]|uniref:hypothetical protein n=1 Tax=Salipiger sp. TaxID=2078585 RepID=UPI003A986512